MNYAAGDGGRGWKGVQNGRKRRRGGIQSRYDRQRHKIGSGGRLSDSTTATTATTAAAAATTIIPR